MLHKTEYSIIPDQIEAGTFMFAAAATKGDVTVLNVIPKHLDATISKLVDIGCEVEEFDDAVRVVAKKRLRCTQVKTLPYPGILRRRCSLRSGWRSLWQKERVRSRKYF